MFGVCVFIFTFLFFIISCHMCSMRYMHWTTPAPMARTLCTFNQYKPPTPTPAKLYYWPFQGDAPALIYSYCHYSSAFCLSMTFCSFYLVVICWGRAVILAFCSCCSYFMRSKFYVSLFHLVSRAGSGIRLHWFLIVACSSILLICNVFLTLVI